MNWIVILFLAEVVQDAQTQKSVAANRPEQKKSDHDRAHPKPLAASSALASQPEHGTANGFDPYKDAFGTRAPNETSSRSARPTRARERVSPKSSGASSRAATI